MPRPFFGIFLTGKILKIIDILYHILDIVLFGNKDINNFDL